MTLQEIVNNMTINQIKKDIERIERLLTCYKNTNQELSMHKKFLKLYYDALNYADSEKTKTTNTTKNFAFVKQMRNKKIKEKKDD